MMNSFSMTARELHEEGQILDEIEFQGLRVRINRTGAEMVSLALQRGGEWTGFLHRDNQLQPPASGWANHATVMGYFLHRLWKEQSVYRGKIIRGGNHGFLRHFHFSAPRILEDGVVYSVASGDIPPEAYPLWVGLELSYRIVNQRVRVEFAFHNEEEIPAHVSFGLHPGFAVGSLQNASIIFPPGTYRRYLAPGNFLNGQIEDLNFGGGEMPFPKKDLPGSFLLGIDQLPNRLFTLKSPFLGTSVTLDFSEVPFMTLWSDADDFLCIEPCWGLPDSQPPTVFEDKIGIQVIAPGSTLRAGFSIQPSRLT